MLTLTPTSNRLDSDLSFLSHTKVNHSSGDYIACDDKDYTLYSINSNLKDQPQIIERPEMSKIKSILLT